MNLSRVRTGKQWGLGLLAALVLALVFSSIALAQLEKIDSGAQHLATQLLPRAVKAGDLRVQLDRLRRLEAGLIGARTLAEVQLYEAQFPEQLQRVQQAEASYEGLLENRTDRVRFDAYSASRSEYLRLQQRLLELAHAVDFSSADSIALSSKELLTTYAGASQNSFGAATAALEEWQHENATAAQRASAQTKGAATSTRSWILGALGGCTLLAALLLLWSLASTRAGAAAEPTTVTRAEASAFLAEQGDSLWESAGQPFPPVANLAPETQAGPQDGGWDPGTGTPRKTPWTHGSAANSSTLPTRVTAEDWESF